jgi:hypothetical protein
MGGWGILSPGETMLKWLDQVNTLYFEAEACTQVLTTIK